MANGNALKNFLPLMLAIALLAAVLFLPAVHPWSSILQLVLLAWGVFLFVYHGTKAAQLELKASSLPLPLFLFFVLAVFYVFRTADYAQSRDFLFVLFTYAAAYFLTANLEERGRSALLYCLVILGTLCALYGAYQYVFGFEKLLQKIKAPGFTPRPSLAPLMGEIASRIAQKRVFSTFLLPSHFAAFLLMTIPLTLGAFLSVRRASVALLFLAALTLQTVVLFLTRSFSGWLAFIVAGGITFSIYMVLREGLSLRRLLVLWVMALTVLAIVFFFLLRLRPDNPLSASNNPLLLRLLNWKVALKIMAKSPLLGKGLATFGLLYPQYQDPGVNVVHHAHNSYLQLGVEMGPVGALLLLWFALWWIRGMVKGFKAEGGPLRLAILMGGLGFLIHNAMDFEFYLPNCGLPGFALLGLGAGLMGGGSRILPLHGKGKAFAGLGAFVIALGLCLFALFPFYGRMYYERARLKLEGRVTMPSSGVADLYRATKFDPSASAYRHALGVALFRQMGRREEGIAEVKKAIALSPLRHQYYYDLAVMYWKMGQRASATEAMRKALELCPRCEGYKEALDYLEGERDSGS